MYIRVQGTCLVAANVVLPMHWRSESEQRSTNPSARFEEPLRGGEKTGKVKEGRKGMEKTGENTLQIKISGYTALHIHYVGPSSELRFAV